jgi:hypothetical protein
MSGVKNRLTEQSTSRDGKTPGIIILKGSNTLLAHDIKGLAIKSDNPRGALVALLLYQTY